MKKIFLFLSLLVQVGLLGAQNVLPGYNGFWSRRSEITVLDLIPYYPDTLALIRNEIYARYGRAFTTKAYQDYFNGRPWYTIKNNFSEDWLSDTDRKNAALILSVERGPALADTVKLALKNIEYRGARTVLTFISRNHLVWTDPDIDFGAYGLSGYNAETMPWLAMGEWVLVFTVSYLDDDYYQVVAYKLDHNTKRVLDSVEGNVDTDELNALIVLEASR